MVQLELGQHQLCGPYLQIRRLQEKFEKRKEGQGRNRVMKYMYILNPANKLSQLDIISKTSPGCHLDGSSLGNYMRWGVGTQILGIRNWG